MDSYKNNTSRKTFLLWGTIAIASATFFKFLKNKKNSEDDKKVKMLAQDGTLVEIDAAHLNMYSAKKISDEELKKWVKKK